MISFTQLILFTFLYSAVNCLGPQQTFLNEDNQENVQLIWKDLESSPSPGLSMESTQSGESIILDFDDLPFKSALSPITTYKNMSFTSFSLLNVPLAINTTTLSPKDINAATSPPNALINSNSTSKCSRIFVTPSPSSSSPTPKFPHKFLPISLRIKPLGYIAPSKFARIEIYAFDLENESRRGAVMVFGGDDEGFVSRSFPLWMDRWGEANVLEIKATGTEGEDRDFTIDDLEVQILEED